MRFGRKFSVFLLGLLGAAGLAFAGEARAAGTFVRGPILQSLGPTGVTVKVELLTPESVSVELVGPDGASKKLGATEAKRFQSVRLDGLSPATTYRYKVLAGEPEAASTEGQFTTAPAENRPFKFIAYGDSRSDPAAHTAVVRALEAAPSDFLVHTGDMVAMGDEEDDWKSFFEIENKLLRDRCVFASIGNHELAGDQGVGAAAFLRYFASADDGGKDRPKLYGSFRWSNTRFFLLNAMDNWSGEERTWLKEELDRALVEPGLAHRFAVLHHGPFSSAPHGGNTRLHQNGVLPILRDGKVDLIIAGHDHTYERGSGEGIKYIVSGGAGAPLYQRKRQAPETLKFESVYHFVEVRVDGERVDVVARRASGSVLEACGFVSAGPWDCDKAAASLGPAAPPLTTAQASSGCSCALPGAAAPTPHGAAVSIAATALLGIRRARRRAAKEAQP